MDSNFQNQVDTTGNFELRRVVERLREGLFDPLGVRLLTSGEAKLNLAFAKGVKALDKEAPSHLCISGAYGQGKSHSLNYLKQQALSQNFVVSYMNLDPREVPFHDVKGVYRSLMGAMEFPGKAYSFIRVWKKRAAQWLALPENSKRTCSDLIPDEIPHRFRTVLAALTHKTMSIPPKKRSLKKHARFKPKEFTWILKNALMGENIPVGQLRSVLYYRQVPFYKAHSLTCRGHDQYLAMVQGMATLFRRIGFKGWLLLFDEGESISQTRITSRSKSYDILNQLFYPRATSPGFYPVFAFTPDFFARLGDEEYDRIKVKKNAKNGAAPPLPYFKLNYSRAWENIHIHSLQNLSPGEWGGLVHKLTLVHAKAYHWEPEDLVEGEMRQKLSELKGVEARLKLKFLVNHLDIEQQRRVTS